MKTSRVLGIKFVWALPAIALLLFAFAEPEYKTKPVEIIAPAADDQKGEKEFVIKGKVVREDTGKPLENASVIIKGTTVGTVSGNDGTFTLVDPNPKTDEKTGTLSSELVVSYVGYESAVIMVGSSGTALENGRFTFKLKEGVIHLDLMVLIKQLPPPPPPPIPSKNEKTSTSSSSMPSVKKEMASPPPPPPPVNEDDEVYTIVEELPEYPKGMGFLANDVMQSAKILAREKGVKGKATIGFTIDETGRPVNVKIIEADNELAGKSAASIIMNMKNWKPGSQHSKKVPVNYILPMEF